MCAGGGQLAAEHNQQRAQIGDCKGAPVDLLQATLTALPPLLNGQLRVLQSSATDAVGVLPFQSFAPAEALSLPPNKRNMTLQPTKELLAEQEQAYSNGWIAEQKHVNCLFALMLASTAVCRQCRRYLQFSYKLFTLVGSDSQE